MEEIDHFAMEKGAMQLFDKAKMPEVLEASEEAL
jgi:hypothetical protein